LMIKPIDSVNVAEGGIATFTVNLSNPSSTATNVALNLAGGTATAGVDFSNSMEASFDGGTTWAAVSGGNVSVAAGATSFQVRTTTVSDNIYEGAETFSLQASVNGSTQTGNSTITDTAFGLADIASATAAEGGYVQFQVGLAGTSTSTTDTSVSLSLANGTTAAGDLGQLQYQAADGSWANVGANGEAVIAAGNNSVQVRTLAVADSVYEGSEAFTLTATANGSTKTGAGSITDTAPTVNAVSNGSALEGDNVVFNVGLSGTSTTATTIDLALFTGTATSADFAAALEYLDGINWVAAIDNKATVAAGQSSVQVRTLAVADGVYEGAETFSLKASANGGAQITGNGTINDIAPVVNAVSNGSALEGDNVVFNVGLSGTSTTATTVDLALVSGTATSADFAATLQYLDGINWVNAIDNKATVAAGQSSVQVRTLAVADGVYEGAETFMLKASANGGAQIAGTGTINDIAPTVNAVSNVSATEGQLAVFTVGLSGTSTTPTTVNLTLTGGTATAVSDFSTSMEYYNGTAWVAATGNQATVAAGQSSVQVRVQTVDDTIVESTEQFTLKASANGGAQITGTASIQDNDVAVNVITPGTSAKDTINGSAGNDLIQGGGGIDLLRGFDGNDTIYAGTLANPNSAGNSNMYGDGGNDTLYGGGTGLNKLNGTNDTLLGVGEKDNLVGGSTTGATSSVDTFVLGNINSSYYLGNGNNDYATISNFDPLKDKIQLSGPSGNFGTNYTIDNSVSGISSVYHVDSTNGSLDLVAKVNTSTPLTIGGSYFIQAPATIIL
jgi:RTX calcium-binding nonapeptide repeat (4 copies)/Calx-beta domain